MRLATVRSSGRDGKLVKVSQDGKTYADASAIAATLQDAIERWDVVAPQLAALPEGTRDLREAELLAPLPRAWQWLDGSAFASHGDLMNSLLGIKVERTGVPLMYQGMSDTFLAPTADAHFPNEDLNIDFEGEYGVVVDAVPMGISAAEALGHIKLLVQINDWSLRKLALPEMKTGFGWVGAKPACSMAPYAVTPEVSWNGARFGNANGEPMEFGFHELVAHAARTRQLVAGTVIGSGTVSNTNFREIGSSCIAERRGIELMDEGKERTGFMRFGDRVRMEAHTANGAAPFGAIDQRVVQA